MGNPSRGIQGDEVPRPPPREDLTGEQILDLVSGISGDPEITGRDFDPATLNIPEVGGDNNHHHAGIIGRFLEIEKYGGVIASAERQMIGLLERRVFGSDRIEPCDEGLDIAGGIPIPALELVFLGIQILLTTREGGILTELESTVDSIHSAQSGGQHRTDHEGWASPLLQIERENIRGVGKEIGAEVFLHLGASKLVEVGLDLRA